MAQTRPARLTKSDEKCGAKCGAGILVPVESIIVSADYAGVMETSRESERRLQLMSVFDALRTLRCMLASMSMGGFGTKARRAATAAAVVLSLASTSAAFSRGAMMLPVAPADPGGGLWKVEQWPDHGCTTCKIDEADATGFRKFLADLGKPIANTAEVQLPVYVVRGGIESGRSSLKELNRTAATCKIGSVGVLLPNTTTDIVAFGVRLDCENAQSSFMSVVMGKAHVPTAVYWLPDGPIVSL